MTDYLGYMALGVGAGAIIAAMALGLLMCQQGASVVNFSMGASMTWVAHVYADLRRGAYVFPFPGLPARYHFDGDVGLFWALVLSMLTALILGLILFRLVFRPLLKAPSLSTVVANIGIIIVITAIVRQRFEGGSGIRVGKILPSGSVEIIGGISMPQDGLWLAAIVALFGLAIGATYRFTRIGLVTRAATMSEKGVVLLGFSPNTLAQASIVAATMVTGLIAILASPMLQLEGTTYTFTFLVPALGAALLGRFRYIVLAVSAGLLIGMIQSSFTKFQVDFGWWPRYGAREGLPFLVIIAAMWFLGESLPSRGSVESWRMPRVPASKLTLTNVGLPIVLAIAGLLFLGPLWRAAIMTSTIAIVFALSFVVVTGLGGQTTLAQMAVAGIAGFGLSRIATDYGVPFPLAPILASLLAMVAGMLVGIPALRVRGTNLAIVTLGGSVAITEFLFKNPGFVGDLASGGAKVPNPAIGGWDLGLILGTESSRPIFGIFLVVVAALAALGVSSLRSGATGRRLLATRGNERAAMAAGIDVSFTKLQGYAISSFIAGIGGCLIAYRFGRVSDASFGVLASLTALSVAYLGGITSVSGAVTAGVLAGSGIVFFGMTQVITNLGPWESLIVGCLLIFTAVLNPEGVAGGFHKQPKTPEELAEMNEVPAAA